MSDGPAFGKADLTNCERELIHLAGSVQPHGILLCLSEPELQVLQASDNTRRLLGVEASALLGRPVGVLGGDIERCARRVAAQGPLADPEALRCRVQVQDRPMEFEGTVHRIAGGMLLVEIEPVAPEDAIETVSLPGRRLLAVLGETVRRISNASTIGSLADAVTRSCRDLLGYDRVMVYKFDPDGHGKIIAEARDPRFESLLGHHYPASDIPQRARELYLRTRLRVLVDVHYEASALVPPRLPGGEELDMSSCYLRSMSPLHLQYLKNMGVSATLVVSLVREGRLWGLIACHHYAPRNLRLGVRAAADMLAEVASTRIAAIENYAHAQVAIQVRRLEQRLVEATSTEGDWRVALFRNPRTLLQPLDATGAALFYEGEVLTAGETPDAAALRELLAWVDAQGSVDGLFSCGSVERANPALDALTPTASGVTAVRLSGVRPDYLMWFRKEQLLTVTWAGDPSKPVVDNDPLKLSPRRSFAAWSEIVRGTALPWSAAELALARAFGASLTDIIVQVNAVRLLIAEHQLAQIRAAISTSAEPVLIAGADGHALFANHSFLQLVRRDDDALRGETAGLFTQPGRVRDILGAVARERQPWRGELALDLGGGASVSAQLRAEPVPGRDGSMLGFFMIFTDLTENRRAAEARRHLEQSLSKVVEDEASVRPRDAASNEPTDVIGAILSNASLAAMDIADGNSGMTIVPLLEELEASTRRATALFGRVKAFSG